MRAAIGGSPAAPPAGVVMRELRIALERRERGNRFGIIASAKSRDRLSLMATRATRSAAGPRSLAPSRERAQRSSLPVSSVWTATRATARRARRRGRASSASTQDPIRLARRRKLDAALDELGLDVAGGGRARRRLIDRRLHRLPPPARRRPGLRDRRRERPARLEAPATTRASSCTEGVNAREGFPLAGARRSRGRRRLVHLAADRAARRRCGICATGATSSLS